MLIYKSMSFLAVCLDGGEGEKSIMNERDIVMNLTWMYFKRQGERVLDGYLTPPNPSFFISPN